jgi:hypothetical protein
MRVEFGKLATDKKNAVFIAIKGLINLSKIVLQALQKKIS